VKTPPEIIQELEEAADGLEYGAVTLAVHLHGGQPRYEITRVKRFPPDDAAKSASGAGKRSPDGPKLRLRAKRR